MKKFIITIDTEGDGQWNPDAPCTTKNARYIPRFQDLAEKYGFKPTWLTNYEMSEDPFYVEYMRDCLNRNQCEVGMHLHAWNNPPEYKIKKINKEREYLIEYPEDIMDKKVEYLTKKLEDTFSMKMVSHRSGRWTTNEKYFQILKKYGYKYDCSVTPYVDWRNSLGATGLPGSDYRKFPNEPYYIHDGILEIPVSIRPFRFFDFEAVHSLHSFAHEVKWCLRKRSVWLRPSENLTFTSLKKVLDEVSRTSSYAMFMLHSSEMMPGGSPYFPDEKSVEELYACTERVFSYARECGYVGCKLSDYQEKD